MAAWTDEKPLNPRSILLKHAVKPVLIPTHRANPYLLDELVLVNLFCHAIDISVYP